MVKHVAAKKKSRKKERHVSAVAMSERELAALGGGKVAYIKVLTSDQAKSMYPSIDDLPSGIQLYCLNAADGSPIALTDSYQAAMGHAIGDELEVASLN